MAFLYAAIGAGVLGLIAAVSSSDMRSIDKIRVNVTPEERKTLEDAERCVLFMQQHDIEIPPEMRSHPHLQMSEKIARMSPANIEKVIRAFLKDERVQRDKLSSLTKSCAQRGDVEPVCRVVREMSTTQPSVEEAAKATPEVPAADTVVSSEPSETKDEVPYEVTLVPAEEELLRDFFHSDTDDETQWKKIVNQEWESSSEVSEGSAYALA